MYAVEAIEVNKSYVKKHLFGDVIQQGVKNLNLQVNQGEVLGLIGLNGAGKTTTMKLLLGLLFPDKGQIKILGKDIQQDVSVKYKIGYLPELPYLPLNFNAGEVLEYYAKLYAINPSLRRERIKKLMDLLGLAKASKRRLTEYSKGMLQRVALAQALLNEPEVLFLDEPVSGLDPLGYKEMRDILLELRAQGKTLVFNSHLLSEVEKLCHRVGVIVQGSLVEQKTAKEIKSKYKSIEAFFVQTVKKYSSDKEE